MNDDWVSRWPILHFSQRRMTPGVFVPPVGRGVLPFPSATYHDLPFPVSFWVFKPVTGCLPQKFLPVLRTDY